LRVILIPGRWKMLIGPFMRRWTGGRGLITAEIKVIFIRSVIVSAVIRVGGQFLICFIHNFHFVLILLVSFGLKLVTICTHELQAWFSHISCLKLPNEYCFLLILSPVVSYFSFLLAAPGIFTFIWILFPHQTFLVPFIALISGPFANPYPSFYQIYQSPGSYPRHKCP